MTATTPLPALVSALPFLPSGRRAVVEMVKEFGSATAEELAQALDVTVSGVRQHLQALENQGLVHHVADRSGRGRPRHRYALTVEGQELFPRRYGDLVVGMLDHLESHAPEVAGSYFRQRSQARVRAALPRLEGRALGERVKELAQILMEDGYQAEVTEMEPGTFHLVERNCAVHLMARRDPRTCRSELDFFRAVLPGATVERTHHLLAGERHCAYRIRKA
ncbi:MAG: ArsR family transcriptional regulator [Gemmatimonadota bacterium]